MLTNWFCKQEKIIYEKEKLFALIQMSIVSYNCLIVRKSTIVPVDLYFISNGPKFEQQFLIHVLHRRSVFPEGAKN